MYQYTIHEHDTDEVKHKLVVISGAETNLDY